MQTISPSQALAHALQHRGKVLAAGTLANAAFAMTFSGIPMTAVMLRSNYGLDTTALAWVLGVMGLGIAASELPWGLLTDRWGDRPVLLTGLIGTTAALAALALWAVPHGGQVPPLWLLGGGLLLAGLLGGSVNGASGRAIMLWFDAKQRGLAMSIRQTAVPLGGALGALLLPWLALQYGFSAVFAVLAAFCSLAATLCALWIYEPDRAPSVRHSPKTPENPSALHNPAVWQLSLGIGLLCAPQFAVLQFGTLFLHDVGHIGPAAIATSMAALQIAAMVLRIWSGHWTDQRGNRNAYLRGCMVVSAVLFAVLAATSAAHTGSGAALALLLVACGTAISAWHGVAYAELATRAGAAQAGTALGLCNTFVFVANFLTPQGVAALLPHASWAVVWLVAAACSLAAWPLLGRRA